MCVENALGIFVVVTGVGVAFLGHWVGEKHNMISYPVEIQFVKIRRAITNIDILFTFFFYFLS